MKDDEIIALYFRRDEDAIRQTELAYGGKLYNLSYRLLWNREDAEESVSDTYMKAWENIPPTKPTFSMPIWQKSAAFLPWESWTGTTLPSARQRWWRCRTKWKTASPT